MPQGAPNIQSYCLGHTAFAACSAFVGTDSRELLLSGSGDGTVRSVQSFIRCADCSNALHNGMLSVAGKHYTPLPHASAFSGKTAAAGRDSNRRLPVLLLMSSRSELPTTPHALLRSKVTLTVLASAA